MTIPRSVAQPSAQPKTALRTAYAVCAVALAVSAGYAVLALVLHAWQLWGLSGVTFGSAVCAGGAVWVMRHGRRSLAFGLQFICLWTAILGTSFLASNVSVVLIVSAFMLPPLITNLTLGQKFNLAVVILSVALCAVTIAIDQFWPVQYRFAMPKALESGLLVTLAVLVVTYMLFVLSRFGSYALRTKLMLAFFAATMLPITLLIGLNSYNTRTNLARDAGSRLQTLTTTQAGAINNILEQQIGTLRAFTFNDSFAALARIVNPTYGATPAEVQAQLERRNGQWVGAPVWDPFVSIYLRSALVDELHSYQQTFPDNLELVVTDRYGGLLAATERTPRWAQNDERWWQAANNNGTGATYVGQPVWDARRQTATVEIALPVLANESQSIIGFIRSTYSLRTIAGLLASSRVGQTGGAEILLPNDTLLGHENVLENVDKAFVAHLRGMQTPYTQLPYKGVDNLASYVPIGSGADQAAPITKLGWGLVAHEDLAEANAPAGAQTRLSLLLATLIAALAVPAALWLARTLTRPLTHLTGVAKQIAGGNLNVVARVPSSDELGTLATTFNQMTTRLRETLGGLEAQVVERERAENEARTQQRFVQSIIENIPNMVFVKDARELRFVMLNKAGEELFGATRDTILGKNDYDFFPSEQGDFFTEKDRAVLDSRALFDIPEEPFDTGHGVRFLHTKKLPIMDEAGNPAYLMGISEDITERKEAETKLRASESQKSAILETALDCIITMDHQGTILEFNPAAERTFGYSRAKAVGQELAALIVPPAFQEGHRRGMAHYLATGEGPVLGKRIEITAMRSDGTEFPVELSITPIPSDGDPLFTGYLRDITERKQAEAELRSSEARYQRMSANVPGIIYQYVLRPDGTVAFPFVGAGAREILELEPEAIQADASRVLDLLDDRETFMRVGMRSARTLEPLQWEDHVTLPSGRGRWLRSVSRPTAQPDGSILWDGIILDVTDRKDAEKRIADRTRALEAAAEISQRLSTASDPSALMTEVVEQLSAMFNYYHAHVYLYDDAQTHLIMVGGTGDAGRTLLKHGHKLLGGKGLVGRAADTNEVVLVPNVAKDPQWMPNPLLPNTRAEIAVPIALGEHVLGVLDVQHDQAFGLTQDDATLLQAIARQVAVAIENARSFAQIKQAEASLRLRDRAMSASSNGISISDPNQPDCPLVYVNPGFEQMTGYKANEVIGYNCRFLQGDDRDQPDLAILRAAIHEGRECQVTLRNYRRDGTLFWNELSISPVYDELGQLVHFVGVQTDITERKQLEEDTKALLQATQAQERTLQVILDNLPVGVLMVDAETKTTKLINQVGSEILGRGLNTDSTIDNNSRFYDAYVPDTDTAFPSENMSLATTLRTGAETQRDFDVKRPDGRRASIEATAVPIRDDEGKLVSAIAVFQDITERKQLLKQTRKRAVELETVAQVSADASQILDVDRLLQAVVDLTKERFGLYHAHVYLLNEGEDTLLLVAGAGETGRQMVAEKRSIPVDRQQSLVARALRTRQLVVVNDVEAVPDFLPHRLLPNTRSELAVPLIIGNTPLGVLDVQSDTVGYFTDEEARVQTTLAGQIAVAVRNAQLYVKQAATLAKLRELDQLKSSFLANMSHELRTPLNSILGFTEVMLEGINGELNDFMRNDLNVIYKNGRHLLQLINDILDMAKIESGTMRLNLERFDVHEAVEEAVMTTQPLARQKALKLEVSPLSLHGVMIDADRARLRQVLLNLVSNAVKFTMEGSVTLRVASHGDGVAITVKDTGVGISPEQQVGIFQEFHQVDNSTTRKVGGTGLGLAISRNLVEMHGGTLTMESTGVLGEGSTFRVTLPLAVATSTEQPVAEFAI